MKVTRFFKIEELVDPAILSVLTEEAAWRLIPPGVQNDLDGLRIACEMPLVINGNGNTHCGVRAKDCTVGAPLSDHKLTKPGVCAFDLHCSDLPKLIALVMEHHEAYGVYRIENPEKTPGWLHVTISDSLQLPPFEIFNP